ncbi:MAG: flagellar protein FlgN [Ketobacteraceae bacterium]|nr:flagellar protein FlgN [Ketobacteraceae bacterium]
MSTQVTPQNAQQFLGLLKKDLSKADQLLQYLEAEKSAIEKRDLDGYHGLQNNKKQLLIEIESLDRERKSLMESMGFSADKQGFQSFLQQVPANWRSRFEHLWESLSGKLNRCKDLNQVNGKILLHAQIATERLMQMIKGVSTNETVYQQNGRTSQGGNARCLATA